MNKKKFCKIFFPVLGTVAVVTGIYWALIEFSLKDLQNIGYISFRYEKNSATKTSVAYITAINQDKNYPSYFEVPKQLKGHKVVGIDAQAFLFMDEFLKNGLNFKTNDIVILTGSVPHFMSGESTNFLKIHEIS